MRLTIARVQEGSVMPDVIVHLSETQTIQLLDALEARRDMMKGGYEDPADSQELDDLIDALRTGEQKRMVT